MAHFYTRSTFLIGIAIGIFLAYYLKLPYKTSSKPFNFSYQKWFDNLGIKRRKIPWDHIRYSNITFHSESQFLFNKVKVLCIILVKTPSNVVAANNTWAKGCNSVKTILLEPRNKMMPTKQLKDKSSWTLLCNLLNSIDTKLFDWIFVARDTSFVILENLRYYVAPLNIKQNHYLGHAVKFWGTVYNSGDPGYALSAGAVREFQKIMMNGKCLQNSYWNKEDYYLGKYLAQMNITPTDTADADGLSTFYPYNWYHVFFPGENYYKTSVFPVNCCSKRSIAFQATEGDKMYTFNYLFYKLQVFTGGNNGNKPFKDGSSDDKTWKQFLAEQNISRGDVSSEEYYKLWENLINDPSSFASNLRKEQLFDYDRR